MSRAKEFSILVRMPMEGQTVHALARRIHKATDTTLVMTSAACVRPVTIRSAILILPISIRSVRPATQTALMRALFSR